LASLIARPVAQKWDGTSIYDVCDLGRPPGNGVRPDVTNVEQNFHTDNSYNHVPPHYVGLMCLRTAMEGGVSGIVSFATAHEEMRRHHPDLLPRLYRPFYFDRQREHAPGDVMTTYHPMLERAGDRLVARLSRFQVNGWLAGETIDPEARRAGGAGSSHERARLQQGSSSSLGRSRSSTTGAAATSGRNSTIIRSRSADAIWCGSGSATAAGPSTTAEVGAEAGPARPDALFPSIGGGGNAAVPVR
jgi:hypothetical protein